MDDETLIAYLDGQLDEARCREIEAVLGADATLAARLDALARASDLARRSLAPRFEEAVPPEMIAAIWRAPDPRRRTDTTSSKTAWTERLSAWLGGPRPRLAFASVLVMLGGAWLALSLADRDDLLAGQVLQDEALLLALDTADSAQVLHTRSATLELLGSFVAQGGEPCRAFTRLRDATETLAIACRDDAGDWTVAFAAEGSAQTDDPGYRTASDERTAEADAFLRDVLRATALDPSEERALIERGWAR